MTSSDAPDIDPWDRQPGETSKSFQAFRCYLELGPGGRSLYDVSVAFYGEGAENGTRKPSRQIEKWSAENNWRARCEAWDNAVSGRATEAVEAAFAAELDVWIDRERETREALWTRANELLSLADKMLAKGLDDARWTWNTVPRIIEAAARLMELSREMRPVSLPNDDPAAQALPELAQRDAEVNAKLTELLSAVRERTRG